LNQYLAFCRLGISWPHNGQEQQIFTNQVDKRCDDIAQYYSTWLDNEREANKDFCTNNPDAKEIFKASNLIHTIETGNGQRDVSLHHKCQAWLQKEEGKKHKNKIVVPYELIVVSENGMLKGNGTRKGNGKFETVTQDEGPVPTTLVVEESIEQMTVENYEPEATATEMPTTLDTQSAPEATVSIEA